MTSTASTPPVTWAQQKTLIFVSMCVEDCKDPVCKIETDKIHFEGNGGTERKDYQLSLDLFGEIDTEKSQHHVTGRLVEFVLTKKDTENYWPRLTKQKVKYHWLRVDFVKWQDADEATSDVEDYPMFEQLMTPKYKDLDPLAPKDLDLDEEEEDSDDEDLPDLE